MLNKLRENIRHLIYESLIINEGIQLQREVNDLSVEICKYISHKEIQNLKNAIEQNDINKFFIWTVLLFNNEFKSFLKKDYKILRSFLDNTRLRVKIDIIKEPQNTKGHYDLTDVQQNPKDVHYNQYEYKNIVVYLPIEKVQDLFDKTNIITGEKRELEEWDLFSALYYGCSSTLAHELQHAFDDYRTKSKIFYSPQAIQYRKDYVDAKTGDDSNYSKYDISTPEGIEQYNKHVKTYLFQPHEVWARFTQAVEKVHFTSLEWKYIERGMNVYTLKPWKDIFTDFRINYKDWYQTPLPIKKRLVNKLMSAYHEEKDRIKEMNDKEFEKHAIDKETLMQIS